MKKVTFTLALIASALLQAQSGQFQIQVAKDQWLSTAFVTSIMDVMFSSTGSHYTDALDQPGSVSDPSFMYPYTIDSALADLTTRDSRPDLRRTIAIPFGVWTATSGEMHAMGCWTNPSDSLLYTVTLIDNNDGSHYNMYNEVTISVASETNFVNRFTIVFTPKINCTGFAESCYGSSNGSVFVESPQTNYSVAMYRNSAYVNTFNVLNNDTLIGGLTQGNYDFIYILDGNAVDTSSAVVTGPAQIIASATISNTTPVPNEAVTFTNTSTGSMDYAWDFGDGFTDYTASPSHAYSIIGTYTVTLIAYNITGCDNSITYVIDVQNTPSAAPDPNLNNRNNSSYSRIANVNVQSGNGSASVVATDDVAITQYSVYSLTGQVVSSGTGDSNSFSYSTPGVYVLHVTYADGSEQSRQVLLND